MRERRTLLLGAPIDIYAPGELMAELERALESDGPKMIFATNPEKVMRARADAELMKALDAADFLIPDGIGAVIGLRLLGKGRTARITGIDLMGRLLESAEKRGRRVFIFGARPEVVKDAAVRILERHPRLEIAGYRDGYVPESEHAALVGEINARGTDILFAALGSPRQEKWLTRWKPHLRARICMGVGGSLDILSGRLSRSPRWVQRAGLEWLYRFLKEPARFWKRGLGLVRYLFVLLKEMIAPEPAP